MNLLYDMHLHSQNSHDSKAPISEIAKASIDKGISGFAVTDHCDIQYYNPAIVESSIRETEKVKEEYSGKVKILKGIEIGEALWNKAYTKEILEKYDYDVVISSVHAVKYKEYTAPYSIIDFAQLTENELDEYIKNYFDQVLQMLKEVDFDIMAHLTCPFRYIIGKYRIDVDIKKYKDQISAILNYIIENSITMEINTSGINTTFNELMPQSWIIEMFKEKGGKYISLGSDAHTPENLAKGFENTIFMLKSLGFDGYCYYENRKRIFLPFK